MQTPFEILEVEEDADDAAIKQAYLKKVKEYPPERQAEAFQTIRKAFESIETDKLRRQYRLFHVAGLDFNAAMKLALKPGQPQRPDADLLFGALAESVLADIVKPKEAP